MLTRCCRAILKKYQPKLLLGYIEGKAPAAPAPKAEAPKKAAPKPAASSASATAPKEALDPYGDLIPYGDPNWYQGVSVV